MRRLITQPQEEICEDCTIPAGQALVRHEDGTSTLRCVKCPFCKEIVDAHMTNKSISCPACQIVVEY